MSTTLAQLTAAVSTVTELWPGERVEGAETARLVALNVALGQARRLLDAAVTQVASEISRQSRPELGADSLAKQQGYRNAATFLATTLGTSTGEATRLVQVGAATAPRLLLTGEEAPARHPHVGEALAQGRIGKDAAAAIISMLDDVADRVALDDLDRAERTLAEQAASLDLDQLRKVLTRAEAYLDPDGVAPKEDELRALASVQVRQDRAGMIHVTAKLDPERGAPVVHVLEAMVTAELAAQRDETGAAPGLPPKPIPVMQADALVALCEHYLGCEHTDAPLSGATVVVRVDLADLRSGRGFGTIDGVDHPVSIGTVRRMAAGGGVIPVVLGGESEILDWGRRKRLFTRSQRLALAERDGGCVGCGAPPGRCKAHHLRWWSRGGATDLRNGVLLCSSCHHRVHDNGWEIRIDDETSRAPVWLIPPAHVDPARTPRPAARRRFDYVS